MKSAAVIWLDMQLPPTLCPSVSEQCELPCEHLLALGMDRTADEEVFRAARSAGAVLITKDSDFARLLDRHGPPPAVIWLRCGNCSTTVLRMLLSRFLAQAIKLIRAGDSLVEISYPKPGSTDQG